MLDIGWSEILLIAVVAIVVIGPKDLPDALRTLGRMVTKVRRMAGESMERFTEKGADPYVIDALRFLRDPERREGRPLTLDLIARMARFLDEARHDPRR